MHSDGSRPIKFPSADTRSQINYIFTADGERTSQKINLSANENVRQRLTKKWQFIDYTETGAPLNSRRAEKLEFNIFRISKLFYFERGSNFIFNFATMLFIISSLEKWN